MNKDIFKELEESIAENEAYRKTFRGRVNITIYSIKNFFRNILNAPRRIKWAYQRLSRGYSDADAWNGDRFLAKNLAGIMNWIVLHGHGVNMAYADDDWSTPVEVMVERRDADYIKYGAIFAEYAKEGIAFDEGWKENFGGVLDSDMEEALQWLSKHFTGLWD